MNGDVVIVIGAVDGAVRAVSGMLVAEHKHPAILAKADGRALGFDPSVGRDPHGIVEIIDLVRRIDDNALMLAERRLQSLRPYRAFLRLPCELAVGGKEGGVRKAVCL